MRLRFAFRDKPFSDYFNELDTRWRQIAEERHEAFTPMKRTPVQTASGISGFQQEIANPSNVVQYYFKNRRGEAFEFSCNPHGNSYLPLENILFTSLELSP